MITLGSRPKVTYISPMVALRASAHTCEVTTDSIGGRSRHPCVILARRVYVAVGYTGSPFVDGMSISSFPELSEAIGKNNHSTLCGIWKKIQPWICDEARCCHEMMAYDERRHRFSRTYPVLWKTFPDLCRMAADKAKDMAMRLS